MSMPSLESLIARINYVVYDFSEKVNKVLNRFILFVSVAALATLTYYTGFTIDAAHGVLLELAMDAFLALFALEFITRLVFMLHRRKFLTGHFPESALATIALLELLSHYLFGYSILHGLTNLVSGSTGAQPYHFLKQIIILLLAISELITQSRKVFDFSIKPASLFLISFVGLSLLGTVLLTFPEMTVPEGRMTFLDALFTATSATCVTGLIVVDTGTFFTLKGQLIILFLMQLGGIGIITFASFFTSFLSQGFGIRHQLAITDIFGSKDFKSSTSLLRQIIFYTLIIEAIGVFLIYTQMGNHPSEPFYDQPWSKLFYAVFHAVSAFCNAGFSLFSNSLMHSTIINDPALIITFAFLIILGGIGFPVLKDLFSIKNIERRRKLPWKGLEINTRVALSAAIILVVAGTVIFYFLERGNSMGHDDYLAGWVHAFFQSVTTRTAGFNSVDISELAAPTVILFLLFMFIGGSSISTAGGIKTSTLVVMMRSVVSVIRNKPQVELRGRSLSKDLIYRAFSIFAFAISFQFLGIFLLTLTEPNLSILDIIFELMSAFNTVGLSRGITADLSSAGKIIIIIFMFIGRVGSLTLAFALSSPAKSTSYRYPSTHMMVG